jgi:hypothetical protein
MAKRNLEERITLRKTNTTPGGVRTGNRVEFEVASELERLGYEVFRRGWPDFLAYKDGKVRFVEVKPPNSSKREWHDLCGAQRRIAKILADVFGVEVEVVHGKEDVLP